MIVGAVEDTVEAIVRPAVGTLVNVGFLREDNAVRLARLGGLADGNGRNEQRAGGEKDFRPVDLSLVYSSLAFFFGSTGVSGLIFVVVSTPSRFLLTLVKRLAHLVPFVSRGKVTRSTGFR